MKLDLMEQNGHGVPIIMKEYGKEAFQIEDNFLTVTIPFNKKNATQETTRETTQEKTSDLIIELIKNNPKITRKKLAEKIGISEDGIKYQLNKLQKEKIIEHIGSTKAGYCKVNK